MAGKKGQLPPISPDLPENLARIVVASKEGSLPNGTGDDKERLPLLLEFLTPMMVSDPRYRGEGKPPRALREPMLLLSWDRRAGSWKVSLTDKVLNVGGSILVPTLWGALEDVEKHMTGGRITFSERKPS